MRRTFYHGSPVDRGETLTALSTKTTVNLVFDGLFLSPDRDAAESFGRFVYAIELDDEEVLEHGEGNPVDDYFEIVDMLKEECWRWDDLTGEQQDALFDAIVYDEPENEELQEILQTEDLGATGWELQRIRGHLAEVYGCQAVAVYDEFGTSYLTAPGVTLRRIK